MKKWFKSIKRFYGFSIQEKLKILMLLGIFLVTNILVRFIPLRFYSNVFSNKVGISKMDLQLLKPEIRLIKKVIRHLPWKVTCLMECIANHLFFRTRGFLIPIYIGVTIEDSIKAHAWVLDNDRLGYFPLNV